MIRHAHQLRPQRLAVAPRGGCLLLAGLTLAGCVRFGRYEVVEDALVGRAAQVRSEGEPLLLQGSARLGRVLYLEGPSGHQDDTTLSLIDPRSWTRIFTTTEVSDGQLDAHRGRLLLVSRAGDAHTRIEERDASTAARWREVLLPRLKDHAFAAVGTAVAWVGRGEVLLGPLAGGEQQRRLRLDDREWVEQVAAAGTTLAVQTRAALTALALPGGRPCMVAARPEGSDLRVAPDGRHIAATCADDGALLIEVATCRTLAKVPRFRSGGFVAGHPIWVVFRGTEVRYLALPSGARLATRQLPYPAALLATDADGPHLTVVSAEIERPASVMPHSYWFGPASVRLIWRRPVPPEALRAPPPGD